jgi:hypothetical protein
MPEGFAQEVLMHNSKAVHRAYAKRADEDSIFGGLLEEVRRRGGAVSGSLGISLHEKSIIVNIVGNANGLFYDIGEYLRVNQGDRRCFI